MIPNSDAFDVVTSTVVADCTRIPLFKYRGGRLLNSSGGSVTVTVKESDKEAGTYVTPTDVGTAGALTIANNESLELPAALFASRWAYLLKSATAATLQFVGKA